MGVSKTCALTFDGRYVDASHCYGVTCAAQIAIPPTGDTNTWDWQCGRRACARTPDVCSFPHRPPASSASQQVHRLQARAARAVAAAKATAAAAAVGDGVAVVAAWRGRGGRWRTWRQRRQGRQRQAGPKARRQRRQRQAARDQEAWPGAALLPLSSPSCGAQWASGVRATQSASTRCVRLAA